MDCTLNGISGGYNLNDNPLQNFPVVFLSGGNYTLRHIILAIHSESKAEALGHIVIGCFELLPIAGGLTALAERYFFEKKKQENYDSSTSSTKSSTVLSKEKRDELITTLTKQKTINTPNKNGFTPLYIASQNGDIDLVKELIINKASINYSYHTGPTPLLIASFNCHIDVVKFLLDNGAAIKPADVQILKNSSTQSPYYNQIIKLLEDSLSKTKTSS